MRKLRIVGTDQPGGAGRAQDRRQLRRIDQQPRGPGLVEARRIRELLAPVVALRLLLPVAEHHHRRAQLPVEGDLVDVAVEHQHLVAGPDALARGQVQSRARRRHRDQRAHAREAQRHRRGGGHLQASSFAHRAAGQDAPRHQKSQRREHGQHIADELGARQREEDHDDDQPDPHQPVDVARGGADVRRRVLVARQQQADRPWQGQRGQHGQIEPERLLVVEAARGEAPEVLRDHEVVEEVRVRALHRHEPGRREREQQHPAGQPAAQPPQRAQPSRPGAPGEQHQERQQQADQPLGEQPGRGAGMRPRQRTAPWLRLVVGQHRPGREQHRRRDAAGHQHVEVGELRTEEEVGHGGEHHRRPQREPVVGPAPQEGEQRDAGGAGAQHRGQPRGPFDRPRHAHRRGADPVEQRRLVEEGQAVEPRHQPVARMQHGERDAHVAAFVGRHQGPRPRGRQQPRDQHHTDPENTCLPWRIRSHEPSVARPPPRSPRTTYSGRPFDSS